MENFDSVFNSWFEECKKVVFENDKEMFENEVHFSTLTYKNNKKYIRVMCNNSAWAFINKENGDILKPASFKAPAKHARGNIFDEHNGMKYITAYGPMYLK